MWLCVISSSVGSFKQKIESERTNERERESEKKHFKILKMVILVAATTNERNKGT